MFGLPSRPDELLWTLCGLLVAFPFITGLVVLGFPIVLLMNNLGLQISYDLKIPVLNGTMTLVGNTIAAVSIAFTVQVVFWAVAIHLARIGVTRYRRFLAASHTGA